MTSIGLVGLAGQYEVGFNEASDVINRCANSLKNAGLNVYNSEVVMCDSLSTQKASESLSRQKVEALIICVCTWAEDHHLLDLLSYWDKPVVIWSFPAVETGSMCGAHQICAVLKELDRLYFPVYGAPDDPEAVGEIIKITSTLGLADRLQKVRIGTVGGRIKGMMEIAFDEFEIKNKTGVRVVNLDEKEFLLAIRLVDQQSALGELAGVEARNFKISSKKEHLLESMQYYLGMKKLIAQYGLDGIVVKCYPNYMGKVCLGYSLLAEERFVCGCEGDINNTVLMKIIYELTGNAVHNTDILYPDTAANTILFSHCGSGGFSLAASESEINLAPVRLADSGVSTLFTAKPGVVTLANLVGRGGTRRMSILTGEAVPTGMEFPGNPLKVRFDKDVLKINREIAELGTGHHWMAGYGDISYELEMFCRINKIQYHRI